MSRPRGDTGDARLVGFGDDQEPVGRFVPDPALHADLTPAERDTVAAVWPFSVTSPERIVALTRAVEHIVDADVPGDVVECGVWRGGSMMAVARTLLAAGRPTRTLWLYDTFTGMTAPEDRDVAFDGTPARTEFERRSDGGGGSTWARAPLDDVRANLAGTGYPAERLRFVVGPVEQTVPWAAPDRIAVLRLDTDWYGSTRHELEHLYDRLVPGGVLLIDDYGHWEGCRAAVDDFFADRPGPPPLLMRVDYSARMLVKR